MPTQSESAPEASVRFTTGEDTHTDPALPVSVHGVGEACFEQAYGKSSSAESEAFGAFLCDELTVRQAVEEALSIIVAAPWLDNIDVDDVDRRGVTAEVSIQAPSTEQADDIEAALRS
jgi:hypothetical protein